MGIVSIQEPLLRDNVNSSAFKQLISGPQTLSSCGGLTEAVTWYLPKSAQHILLVPSMASPYISIRLVDTISVTLVPSRLAL